MPPAPWYNPRDSGVTLSQEKKTMRRTFLLIGLITLMAAMLFAADLTGKWTGQFDFNGNAVPLTFDLTSSGATLTGKVNGLPTDECRDQGRQDRRQLGDVLADDRIPGQPHQAGLHR